MATASTHRVRGFQETVEVGVGGEDEGGLFADGVAVHLHCLDELIELGGLGVLAVGAGVDYLNGFALAFGAGLQGQGDLLAWLFPPSGAWLHAERR